MHTILRLIFINFIGNIVGQVPPCFPGSLDPECHYHEACRKFPRDLRCQSLEKCRMLSRRQNCVKEICFVTPNSDECKASKTKKNKQQLPFMKVCK